MESRFTFMLPFLDLGFSEPVLVMESLLNSSLFEKRRQRFLLIPRKLATILEGHIDKFQTKSATSIGPSLVPCQVTVRLFGNLRFGVGVSFFEIVTQHRLIPGKQFQIWCSLRNNVDIFGRNNVDIAFGFLPIAEANVAPQNPLRIERSSMAPSPAEIPEIFISDPPMVMQKELNQSLSDEKQHSSMNSMEEDDILRLLPADLYPDLDLDWPHCFPPTGPSVFESKDSAEKSDVDTTCELKNINSEVGFALVDVDKTNVQVEGSNLAREIPEEIKDRIKGFEGSGLVFVMEKTLLKLDVQSSTTHSIKFSMPLGKIENQFLSDEENHDLVTLHHDEGIDAFLIGPSIDPDDVEEFNIKMMKRGWESYCFQGAGWKDFVEKYGLEEGKKVLIWSFRRPCANTDS